MYKLIALVVFILVSTAGTPAALAQELPPVEGQVYQEEDYRLFGLDEPGLSNQGYTLLRRTLPSTPGGKPTVAITWDDGSSALTHRVLDVAARYDDVVLTFFVNNREPVPGTFQRALDEGHGIASHGSNHVALAGRPCSSIRQQILGVEPFVNARIDEPISISAYRPPFGATNDSVRNCMSGAGYEEYTWNRDTRDWTYPGVAAILREFESMGDGDIILLHDSQDKYDSVEAFRIFLERHHDKYSFVMIPGAGFHEPCETGSFADVCVGHMFYGSIEWLKASGITAGCNSDGTRFCPDDQVTRGQMAAFLARGLPLAAESGDRFIDDNDSMFESSINRLAESGITMGCNTKGTKFCPDRRVTRGEMAAFLARALDLPAYNGPDRFSDDDSSIFESAIERLAQAGVTVGCNSEGTKFCPGDYVTRGQMAAFLKRALG